MTENVNIVKLFDLAAKGDINALNEIKRIEKEAGENTARRIFNELADIECDIGKFASKNPDDDDLLNARTAIRAALGFMRASLAERGVDPNA